MIENIEKGRGFRGTLNYVFASVDAEKRPRETVEVVGGTMAGRSPRELSAEFGALRRQRPKLGIAVCHASLRLAPGDRPLSREEWAQAGKAWAEGMGFDSYVLVSHGDHLHIVASRIRADGSVVSDSNDFARGERLVRGIEQELGLVRVEASHLLDPTRQREHRKALTRGEVAQAERGQLPPAEFVRQAIERKLNAGPCTAPEFVAALEAEGISVRPNLASTGRLNGFGYEFDNQPMTAKQLGGAYTLKHLQGRGLSYEPSRDHQRLRDRSTRPEGVSPGDRGSSLGADQAAAGANAGADRDGVSELGRSDGPGPGAPGDKPRGTDPGNERRPEQRADGPADGPAEGPRALDDARPAAGRSSDQRDQGADRAEQQSDRGVEQPDGRQPRSDADAADAVGRPAPRVSGGPRPDAATAVRRDRPSPVGDRLPVGGGVVERITDLAAPALAAGRGSVVGASGRGDLADPAAQRADGPEGRPRATDRTALAVERYLHALDAYSYTLAVRRPDGTVIRREALTPDQVRQALPWLRRENALGADVYARPGGTAYVLLDDVPAEQIAAAKAAGHEPALVMETSPGNLAAWVRVGHGLTVPEATELNRAMAKRYGADPAAIDPQHLSRLPGLTNRKPERQRADGQAPFVLIREAWGKVCTAAEKAREWARKALQRRAEQAQAQEATRRLEVIQGAGNRPSREPADAYRHHASQALRADPQASQDRSRLDYRAAQRMLQAGHTRGEVAEGIEAASPELAQRKGEAAAGYAERTAEAAWRSEPVQRHLAAQQAQAEQQRPGLGYR